jgi:hypothetical protein
MAGHSADVYTILAADSPIAIILGLVGLFLLIGALALYEHRRKRSVAELGTSLGFRPAPDPILGTDLPFGLFRTTGGGSSFDSVMEGTWEGMEVTLFDYTYVPDTTGKKIPHEYSCAVTDVSLAAPSSLAIRRSGKIMAKIFGEEIPDVVIGHEEFDKTFRVNCLDERFARTLVDASLAAWLLAQVAGSRRTLGFEVSGSRLLCYSIRLRPSYLPTLMASLKGFRDRIPHEAIVHYPPTPGPGPD